MKTLKRPVLGDEIVHGLNIICVAMRCLNYKTTEKEHPFVSGIVKERHCGGNGFVVDLKLFEFQDERLSRGINRNEMEEAKDKLTNSCKIADRVKIMVNCKPY